jgi:hypothetical protein
MNWPERARPRQEFHYRIRPAIGASLPVFVPDAPEGHIGGLASIKGPNHFPNDLYWFAGRTARSKISLACFWSSSRAALLGIVSPNIERMKS